MYVFLMPPLNYLPEIRHWQCGINERISVRDHLVHK